MSYDRREIIRWLIIFIFFTSCTMLILYSVTILDYSTYPTTSDSPNNKSDYLISDCLVLNNNVDLQRCCSIIVKTNDKCIDNIFPDCNTLLQQSLNASACCDAGGNFNIFVCDECLLFTIEVFIKKNNKTYNISIECEPSDYHCALKYNSLLFNTTFTCIYNNNKVYPIIESEYLAVHWFWNITLPILMIINGLILIVLTVMLSIIYCCKNDEYVLISR